MSVSVVLFHLVSVLPSKATWKPVVEAQPVALFVYGSYATTRTMLI